ncbi:lipoprotein [Thiomicrospira aerophila]|uniref:hypothetical protein n=1 Tax=Thiomicrospira aerophila TaxID=92245 RepID=UPI00022C5B4F|nr:hypothetical protein [Thiomicrospira aerophila]
MSLKSTGFKAGLLISLLWLMGGCGKKGPLTLPDKVHAAAHHATPNEFKPALAFKETR